MNFSLKILLLLFSSWFFQNHASSQLTITGIVSDSSINTPIAYASVIAYSDDSSKAIIAYSITDSKGYYKLLFSKPYEHEKIQVTISAIGYNTCTIHIPKAATVQNVALVQTQNTLPSIEVINRKMFIKQTGDTISYMVKAFQGKGDYTIDDILKKLPGLEVSNTGKISFNGRPISAFYINGINLFDDKYSGAANGISSELVESVDILERHQPIRVLKNQIQSQDVALNLNLKKGAKLAHSGMLHLGVGNGSKKVSLASLFLKGKVNGFSSFKSNNIGEDITQDTKSQNIQTFLKVIEINKPSPFLNPRLVAAPEIGEHRTLLNNTSVFNTNNIVKLNKFSNIKTNIFFVRDKRRDFYNNEITFWVDRNSIQFFENFTNNSIQNTHGATIAYDLNKENHFFLNKLSFERTKSVNTSKFLFEKNTLVENFPQHIEFSNVDFQNETTYHGKLGKRLFFGIESFICNHQSNEGMSLLPNTPASSIVSNSTYDSLFQRVKQPFFFVNGNGYLKYKIKNLFLTLRTGIAYRNQRIESEIELTANAVTQRIVADSFSNNLFQKSTKYFLTTEFNYFNKKIDVTFSMPFTVYSLFTLNRRTNANSTDNLLASTPAIQFRYSFNSNTNAGIFLQKVLTFVPTSDYTTGFIIKDFRTIYRNNSFGNESNGYISSFIFNTKNIKRLSFFNLNISYSTYNRNVLQNNQFLSALRVSDYTRTTNTLPVSSFAFYSAFSKYILPVSSTLNIGVQYQTDKTIQNQNYSLSRFKYSNFSLNISLNTTYNKYIGSNISVKKNRGIGRVANSNNEIENQFTQFAKTIAIQINPKENIISKLKLEHFNFSLQPNINTKIFFLDLSTDIVSVKKGLDISLQINNLLNQKYFTYISNKDINIVNVAEFLLRDRYFLVSAKLKF